MNTNSKSSYALGIFLLLFGIIFAGVGVDQVNLGKQSEEWSSTTAVITNTYIEEDYDNDDHDYTYYPQVKYEFSVNGKTYTGDSFSPGGMVNGYSSRSQAENFLADYRVGSNVTVYYDPDNPEQNALSVGVGGDAYIFLVVGIFITLSGLVALIVAFSHNKSYEAAEDAPYTSMAAPYATMQSAEEEMYSQSTGSSSNTIACSNCGNICHPQSNYCPVCNSPLHK